MPQRIRKLIGTVLIVALVVLYALVATAIATHKLADASSLAHLTYFFITGVFWIVPAMFIIKWMLRPDNS